MNLGDGLLFELENGKPKLIFNNHGFESKTSSRISKNPPRNRPPRLVPALKQVPPQPPHSVRPQRTPAKGPTTCKNPSDTTAAPDTQAAHCLRKTKAKRVDRVQSANRSDSHAAKTASEITRSPKKNLEENLVCLTQDQLQQILSSINQTACLGETQKVTEDPRDDEVISRQTDEALVSEGNIRRNGSAQDKGKDDKKVVNGAVAGFFSRLGERELEKEALEAKRAQWRRELDEQLVEKQQQRGGAEAVVRGAPWRLSATSSCRGSQLREESCAASSMGDAEGRGSTFSSQRDLPAAIRSAFVLGEASPSDEAFSADRKEQQRLWLQELERQREEAHQRRRQEKLLHSQAEDHDRWTMHFDSLHKSVPPPQPPAGVCSSLPPPRSPSGAQSSGWEAASVCGGDGQGRASADTLAGGNPPKASHLRTMTALLDPAQLEERERKRLKQLEHQRAINTQVEERRRQKEQERLEQKRQEQEEEKRVAKEREHLQQQYLLDMQRERHKEKLLSRRTEEMLLSVQRAQEEAQKDKQLQRIRDLARKGHDVSKLLGSLERRSTDLVPGRPLRDSDLSHSAESQSPAGSLSAALRIEELSPVSPRRDTGVQTVDMDGGILDAKRVSDPPVLDKATVPRPTPPCPRKPGREAQQQQQSSGKENVWNSAAEPPGGPGQSDPYERFRRTAHRPRPGDGKRPEWNTRRPSRPFVPASERYPAGTRVHRQESRLRRQMELLTLVERNTNCRSAAPPLEPVASASPQTQDEYSDHPTAYTVVVHADRNEMNFCSRGRSSPISALGLNQQPQHHRSLPQQNSEGFSDAPPASDFVPYVRTDDVYHLDPLAVPHTQEPPRKQQTGVGGSRQSRPNAVRDPLLHPELLKTSERQQAILKGLSELRQGLLQKQRELETSLNPLLQGQGSNMAAPF